MRRFIGLMLMMVMVTVAVPQVAACGGGAPLYLEELDKTDVIVYGTVLETDDRGYNAILRVDKYFKGSGGMFITVLRRDAALEITADIRSYDTSCLYDGNSGLNWVTGSTGYFALTDNGDGTFTDLTENTRNPAHFFPQHGTIEYH